MMEHAPLTCRTGTKKTPQTAFGQGQTSGYVNDASRITGILQPGTLKRQRTVF